MITKVLVIYSFNDLYDSSWGGAVDTLKTIMENDKEDALLSLINDILEGYDGGLDRTQLNDYIWFDREDIFESLGIKYE